jgi:hypothetical protein
MADKELKDEVKNIVEVVDVEPSKEETKEKEEQKKEEQEQKNEEKIEKDTEKVVSQKSEDIVTKEAVETLLEDENAVQEKEDENEKDPVVLLEKDIKKEGIELHQDLDDARQAKVEILAEEIKDRHSVIFFGARAQEAINRVSESMLQGVKSKDLGYAGESLNSLFTTLPKHPQSPPKSTTVP